jgi:AraC-like DNA-binding protein
MLRELRCAILELLPDGRTSLAAASSKLGLSTRTLQRRLASSGHRYTDVVAAVRQAHALNLLERTALSITQVSRQLGFANLSGFSRAFRAWTGVPPRSYRKARTRGAHGTVTTAGIAPARCVGGVSHAR